jgi:hypothetical protein
VEKNKILDRYNIFLLNHAICIDISFLDKNRCYIAGIDLASRAVVVYLFKSSKMSTGDVLVKRNYKS